MRDELEYQDVEDTAVETSEQASSSRQARGTGVPGNGAGRDDKEPEVSAQPDAADVRVEQASMQLESASARPDEADRSDGVTARPDGAFGQMEGASEQPQVASEQPEVADSGGEQREIQLTDEVFDRAFRELYVTTLEMAGPSTAIEDRVLINLLAAQRAKKEVEDEALPADDRREGPADMVTSAGVTQGAGVSMTIDGGFAKVPGSSARKRADGVIAGADVSTGADGVAPAIDVRAGAGGFTAEAPGASARMDSDGMTADASMRASSDGASATAPTAPSIAAHDFDSEIEEPPILEGVDRTAARADGPSAGLPLAGDLPADVSGTATDLAGDAGIDGTAPRMQNAARTSQATSSAAQPASSAVSPVPEASGALDDSASTASDAYEAAPSPSAAMTASRLGGTTVTSTRVPMVERALRSPFVRRMRKLVSPAERSTLGIAAALLGAVVVIGVARAVVGAFLGRPDVAPTHAPSAVSASASRNDAQKSDMAAEAEAYEEAVAVPDESAWQALACPEIELRDGMTIEVIIDNGVPQQVDPTAVGEFVGSAVAHGEEGDLACEVFRLIVQSEGDGSLYVVTYADDGVFYLAMEQ